MASLLRPGASPPLTAAPAVSPQAPVELESNAAVGQLKGSLESEAAPLEARAVEPEVPEAGPELRAEGGEAPVVDALVDEAARGVLAAEPLAGGGAPEEPPQASVDEEEAPDPELEAPVRASGGRGGSEERLLAAPAEAQASSLRKGAEKSSEGDALPSVLIAPGVESDPESKALRRQEQAMAARASRATVLIDLPSELRLGPGGALPAPRLRSYGTKPKVPLRAIGLSLAAVAVCAVALLAWRRRDGQMRVVVSTVAGAGLAEARVFVDGKLVCKRSPCVQALSPGVYRVRAQATGMEPTAERSVHVKPGATLRHQVEMLPADGEDGRPEQAPAAPGSASPD